MAGLRFIALQSRPMEFLDFTSLTLDEFQQLVPPFETAFHARMAAWRMDPTFKGVWHLPAYFEAWRVFHTTSGQCLEHYKPYYGAPATRGHGGPPETPPGSAPLSRPQRAPRSP